MKAEHRKELGTNVLADRVGRAIQSMKHRPNTRTLLVGVLVVVVLIGGWIFFRSRQLSREDNSKRWLAFALGDLDKVGLREKNNTARAALFERAWMNLWDHGLKKIGLDPERSLNVLENIEPEYESMARDAKDDPVYLPEALYALAVIEETRALRDRKHLDTALERYKAVADKHKGSAFGKLALDRIEILEDSSKRRELGAFYQDLQDKWKIKETPKIPDRFK